MKRGELCPDCKHPWALHPPGRQCQSPGCCCQANGELLEREHEKD